MNILLTNDDGYQSSGLQILCTKLAELGHSVYVVAPDGQRSGFSHATNFFKDLTLKRLLNYCGAKEAYACSGTPADCVRIGTLHLGVNFDLLIAGPNKGANVGRLIVGSGTVAAAEEGALCDVKSIALSRSGRDGAYFAVVQYLADNLTALHDHIKPYMFLNINVPNLSLSDIKGVKVCKQSIRLPAFNDECEIVDDDTVRIVGSRRVDVVDEGCDVVYLDEGYITVTPIAISRTDNAAIKTLKDFEK